MDFDYIKGICCQAIIIFFHCWTIIMFPLLDHYYVSIAGPLSSLLELLDHYHICWNCSTIIILVGIAGPSSSLFE